MRKILYALLSSITGKRPGSSSTSIKYVKQSDAALARKFFAENLRRVIVLSLIPLTILGSLSIFITVWYIRGSIEQNSENRLNQINQLTEVIPAELDSLSLSFDKDPKIKIRLTNILNTTSFSFEEVEALFYLRNVIDVPANSKSYIHSIYIYYENSQGRFLSSRDGIAQVDSTLDTSWYSFYQSEAFKGGEELITQPRELMTSSDPNGTTQVLTVYQPFGDLDAKGHPRGLIVMNILPSYFAKSLNLFNDWEGSYSYIADSNGTPLITSDSFGGSIALPAAEQLTKGQLLRSSLDGALVTMKQSRRLAWIAVSVIPTKALYSLPRMIVYITLALSVFSLLLSMLYALWITRKNYRQVTQIVHVLEHADRHEDSVPAMPERIQDVYELIVKNILDTFLEQKYLRIQLSERQAKMELLELKALQSQMNPHFMSNTLHSIYWKAFQLTRSPNDACVMIEQLSDLLEYALRGTDDAVTLQDELANVRGYIQLQKTRFSDRLQVIWDTKEEMKDCRVVKISMQPLVENSIHIGLAAQDRLAVKVKCRMNGTSLHVTIIDNGPGIPRERLGQICASFDSDAMQGKHLGLFNTNKRLMLHYGAGKWMRVLSKEGKGTAITLIFPQ
ncbi:sensor histidine kinase [Paenibacillus sp. GCM10023248]|uniref:cache domain-containing sensor histidine kinase n=1 Tax=Bacillales TaxID=1385 RepID=UPI0023780021|nr:MULTISPECIES: sensor histidine kinase [Bacillales]MDD9265575.1 histidine kinase [Paenibacillus sp. MAHUQ-63]MDR6878813.1 two-component system sensor histidine kinase YesM [Bacillus sp. 3255]